MKIYAVAGVVFFVTSLAWGARTPEVLFQAPDTDTKEYQAFLRLNPGFVSPEKAFESSALNSPKRVELMRAVVEAQRAYFTEDLTTARAKMILVDGFRHLHDWPAQDRRTLFQNLVRLAQITPDAKEQKSWLLQAKAFAPDLKPDPQLFPPPLVKAFEEVLFERIKWNPGVNGLSSIFVNGRKVDSGRGRAVDLPSGHHRLTVISSVSGVETRVGEIEEITFIPHGTHPLVAGNCDHPLWLDSKRSARNALYPGGCLTQRNQTQNTTVASVPEMPSIATIPLAPDLSSTTKQVKPNFFARVPNWVWWTIGASAAGVVTWQVIENQKSDSGPSVKEGL